MGSSTRTLEIVCTSVGCAVQAEAGGADRIELCAAIELGGLTPPVGMVMEVRERCKFPIMAMLRPRTGGFYYSDLEFLNMRRDLDRFLELGIDGVVFGILLPDGRIDGERCGQLVEQAAGAETVCHRAFDVTPDPKAALEDLIEVGFSRVLTSGQQPTAVEGADLIRELLAQAAGRIEILPGCGIRAENVRDLVASTGVSQVHLSAFQSVPDSSTASSQLLFNVGGISESSYQVVGAEVVRAVRAAMDVASS
jgi:copper homeostasis protein